jgi:hypothetical protein
MPTIIDELVVQFGIDAKPFEEGRRALDEQVGKAKQSAESLGKTVEQQGVKIGEAFAFAKRGAAGILATFVGGEAASFIDHLATMDAHTGRLARSINMATKELSAWQNMITAVGGQPGDANALFAGMNDAFLNMSMGNQMPSPGFASLMSRSGVDFRHMSPEVALKQMMQFLSRETPQMQSWWLSQIPGMNEGARLGLVDFINDPQKMRNLEETFSKLAPTPEQIRLANELKEKSTELNTSLDNLARAGFPVLTTLANGLTVALQAMFGKTEKPVDNPSAPIIEPGTPLDSLFNYLFPGGIRIGSGSDSAGSLGGSSGAKPSRAEVEAYIRKSAISQNIDPDVAVKVAMGESGLDVGAVGDKGTSFGVFQLHYGGLAEYYEQLTKHSARDASRWRDQVDFAMAAARSRSWAPWHAWHGKPWQGINQPTAGAAGKQSSVTINGGVHVTSSKADPKAVADQIPEAMKRYSMLAGVNTGLV